MMQDRLDSTRNETRAVRSVVDKAKRMLEGLGSMEIPAVDADQPSRGQMAGVTQRGVDQAYSSDEWHLGAAEFS